MDNYTAHMAEYEASGEAPAQAGNGSTKKLSNGAVVLIVLGLLICTPFCCLGWKRWAAHIDATKDDSECSEMEAISQMHENRVPTSKLLPFERWIQKQPVPKAQPAPKVCAPPRFRNSVPCCHDLAHQ